MVRGSTSMRSVRIIGRTTAGPLGSRVSWRGPASVRCTGVAAAKGELGATDALAAMRYSGVRGALDAGTSSLTDAVANSSFESAVISYRSESALDSDMGSGSSATSTSCGSSAISYDLAAPSAISTTSGSWAISTSSSSEHCRRASGSSEHLDRLRRTREVDLVSSAGPQPLLGAPPARLSRWMWTHTREQE